MLSSPRLFAFQSSLHAPREESRLRVRVYHGLPCPPNRSHNWANSTGFSQVLKNHDSTSRFRKNVRDI